MKSLIKKTLKNETNREYSIAEDVEYINIKRNIKVSVKAIIGLPEFEKKEGKNVVDEVIFHSMDLASKPATADVVIYDNTRYIVTNYKTTGGLYDVTAVASTHNRGIR